MDIIYTINNNGYMTSNNVNNNYKCKKETNIRLKKYIIAKRISIKIIIETGMI